MKIKIIFLAISLSFLISGYAQNIEKFINVGDTTINLADVDLDIGTVFSEKKQYVDNIVRETQIKLFTNITRNVYAIVHDTSDFYGLSAGERSSIKFFIDGSQKFEKSFDEMFISDCFIPQSSSFLIVKLSDDNASSQLVCFDTLGNEIASIDNNEGGLYKSENNEKYLVRQSSIDSVSRYYFIDSKLPPKIITIDGNMPKYIKFSPRGKYIIVSQNDIQKLFDSGFIFIWEEPVKNGIITIFEDEQRYICQDPYSGYLYIRSLINKKVIYIIKCIRYNEEEIPIRRFGVFENDIMIVGKNAQFHIIQFLNEKGEIIQEELIPITHIIKNIKAKLVDSRYIIITNYH